MDEAAEYAALVGNGYAAAHSLAMAAILYRELGEPRVALEKAVAAGIEARRIGSRLGLGTADFAAANALFDLGERDAAIMLAAHARAIDPRDLAGPLGELHQKVLVAARDALEPARVAELEQRGGQLTDDEALDLARTAAARAMND